MKKLGSIRGSIGYSQDCFHLGSTHKSAAKELKLKHRNSTPILMLQAGTTISNSHLGDQWREAEVAAGSKSEAWDDFTGLSLDPKGVLNARRQELDYIAQEKYMGCSAERGSEAQWVEDHQIKMDRRQ